MTIFKNKSPDTINGLSYFLNNVLILYSYLSVEIFF